jgi:hypothetical protein
MPRYFAFNSFAGCDRVSAGAVESNSASSFDSAYVDNSISLNNGTEIRSPSPMLDGSTSVAGDFWLRFDWVGGTNTNASIFSLYNGADPAFRHVFTATNTSRLEYWNGSAWTAWTPTFTTNGSTRYVIVCHFNPGAGTVDVYLGGILVASQLGAPSGPGVAAITQLRFTGYTGTSAISQVMAASYDIRDAHLMNKRPAADGFYNSDGVGTYADIDELVLDDGDAVQLASVGQKRTFTKGAITVPFGLSIAGMVVSARGRTGGAIGDGQAKVRSNGVDENSADLGYGGAYGGKSAFFANDPDTAASWTEAGYNAAEFGFEAVA